MRIGLFSDTYPPEINGVANSTYILRTELLKQGHDVYVITTIPVWLCYDFTISFQSPAGNQGSES